MKILCFAGSLRTESLNKKYVKNVVEILGDQAEYLDLLDYPMPVFNQDIETKEFPDGVKRLVQKVKDAKAIIISTPEYNGSVASSFKTVIDWLSRAPLNPWPKKHILLIGASPGALGAVRGLWHSRQPLEVLGCFVYPEMMGLPKAHEAFDENGKLKDPATRERLVKLVNNFVTHIGS